MNEEDAHGATTEQTRGAPRPSSYLLLWRPGSLVQCAVMENADRPAVSPRQRSGDYVARARELVERAIRRRWEEGLLNRDPDGVFTAMLGAEHVERLMQPRAVSEPTPSLADFACDPASPLGDLVRRFELSASEADLLVVLLACEVEPAVARLIAYLGGNQSQFAIMLDLMDFPGKEFFASPVGRACPGGL